MKKVILSFFSGLALQTAIVAQSISATVSPNPVAAGDSVTINVTFSTSTASDIIQLNLELVDSAYAYISTADYRDFTVPSTGTNQTVQYKVQIPPSTAPSATIGTDFYFYKIELRDSQYNWIAGHYETLTVLPSTISIDEETLATLRVYPNPATNRLFVDAQRTNSVGAIYDAQGKLVIQLSTISEEGIDISNLATGLYFVKIDVNAPVKFIKN